MGQLVVVGGHLREIAGGLHREVGALFDRAIVATVDLDTRKVTQRMSWRDPDWDDQANLAHVFKGVAWYGEQLLLATQRNLLWVDPRSWEVNNTWTHRAMNDVHHAAWLQDHLWVACSGLDAVLEVLPTGEVVIRGVLEPMEMPRGDQRALDLAPDQAHPNHLFEYEGEVWATRFQKGDAVSISGRRRRRMGLSRNPVHDGVVTPSGVYFTGVEGRVLHMSRHGLTTVRLQAPDQKEEPLGWCRGIAVGGSAAWVGFTRIRLSRFREHVSWAGHRLDGTLFETRRPTRLQRHDLRSGALLDTIELEGAEIDAVFGVVHLA